MLLLRFSVVLMVLFGIAGSPIPANAIEYYELAIGQSARVFKGARRNCSAPPSWQEFQRRLPSTGIGRFTDGGTVGVMVSICPHRIAAREIYFTAERPGRISFNIDGNGVVITVRGGAAGSAAIATKRTRKTDRIKRRHVEVPRKASAKAVQTREKPKKRRAAKPEHEPR